MVVTLACLLYIVVHDVSGCAALYHFEFMDGGGCVRVPDDAGIF